MFKFYFFFFQLLFYANFFKGIEWFNVEIRSLKENISANQSYSKLISRCFITNQI